MPTRWPLVSDHRSLAIDRADSIVPGSYPPPDVLPANRAALTRDVPRSTQTRLEELRAMEYADYLQSPEWRRRRNARILGAHRRCERCRARRELQVHHVSYARLGEELDTDLEVLCRACHEGHHLDESRRQHLGIYVKLASDALRAERFTTTADLCEAVRDRCLAVHVPYCHDRVLRAVEAVTTNRVQLAPKPAPNLEVLQGTPISHADACAILKTLGLKVPVREIPRAAWSDPDAYQRELDAARALDEEAY